MVNLPFALKFQTSILKDNSNLVEPLAVYRQGQVFYVLFRMHWHNCAQSSWAGKTCGKVYSVSLVLCNRDKATRPSGSRAETKRHCSDTQLRATPANRGSTASFSFEGCCCHYSIHHWHMPWHERTCLTCVHNFNRPKTLVASTELQGTTKTDDANGTGKWDRFLYSFIRIHTLLLVAKAGSMALHISKETLMKEF